MITTQQYDSSNGVDNSDDDDDSILYFNVLTRQLQEPITESAQENNKCTKICLCIIYYLQNNNINNDNRTNYCLYSH
jgi:hypothetical protein